MLEECFWIADASSSKPFAEKPLPPITDVAVIGGGFTGTSAALRLAKEGAKVTLLETHTVGWGASSRNGGQALSCLYRDFTKLVELFGKERARAMFLTSVKASDTVERIVREENIDCDYSRCGNIEAASKPAHFDRFKYEQETLANVAGYEVRILPKNEMRLELGTEIYHGLMINERSASLQPAKFVQGLATAAERAGAEIYEGTRVIEIDRVPMMKNGVKFSVKTDQGTVSAKEVFLAANAWIGQIVPQFRHKVFPAESFIISTKPLPEDLVRRLIPNKRVVYDTKNMLAYYKFSADNRMVFGGEGTATGMSAKKNIEILQRGMIKVFPELSNVDVDYYWGGTLGLTLDENTHAGQIEGMWYSMCYVGHGVSLATYMGEQIANAILGKEYNNPFDNINIPLVPFYEGQAWFVNLGKAWYRFLDKVS
jgi:glycine/D-amino acid oxidase-like deaminating enzyme